MRSNSSHVLLSTTAVSLSASCKLILHNFACIHVVLVYQLLLGVSPDCDHTSQPCPHRRTIFGLTVSVSFLSVQRWWQCAWNVQQLFNNDTRPASPASWLVSDGSHRQHRWSPPTTSARSTAPSSCSRDPCLRHKFVPAATRPSHCRHHQSVPIRSLFATFRAKPQVLLLTLTMLPSIHLFCLHCWSCRSAVSKRSATQLVASYIAFSSTIRLCVLLQLPPRNNVLVSIAALPDVTQFDWTMCSVEQAALHTLASHLVHFKKIDCVSGLSHTLHKSRIRSSCVTPLVFSHRLRCVNCQDSRLQVRDSRFLSLCLWVTCALRFESPPVSQRQEPPCVDSVGSPRNSAWLRAHGQPQSNRHTTHQHDASCQCSREQLGVPTWHWFFVALRPALAALQCASRKPPDTSLLCIFQLACSQAQASMTRGQLRAFRGQHGDASNNDGFQCLSKSCHQVHVDGSVQPLCSTTSTLSQSSHGRSGRTPDGRRPIPRIVRKALAALPWFFLQ